MAIVSGNELQRHSISSFSDEFLLFESYSEKIFVVQR